jgi:adenylosuccinate synthase
MIIDLQYGSTGKGLLAGYLAKRENYDTAICAFATNAGHTYMDANRGIMMMTQQLPTAISSPSVKNVLLGPGSLIHPKTLFEELERYAPMMVGKTLMIHPHAAVVEDYHATLEQEWGMSKMGSTTKGVGAAMIERIRRSPKNPNIAAERLFAPMGFDLGKYVVTADKYAAALAWAENVIVEGAQGFSLSMYHGQYPYTTSRDVTPWQIAADCGLPYSWASYIQIKGTLRTFPIRVSNRDGSSGPCYPDQREISWSDIGITPELTTVTKLPRRIFTFSQQQLTDALRHCGGYWNTELFLNFANYIKDVDVMRKLVADIERPIAGRLNAPKVSWLGFGPDDHNVVDRTKYDGMFAA